MYRKVTTLIVIVVFFATLIGCASIPEEHKGAATGAGIGAAVGVIGGSLLGASGARTEMAILGGLLGALAGGLIGHYAVDQKRTSQQTAKKYDYQSSRGVMVQIEDVTVIPSTIRIGEQLEIKVTYAILGAGTDKELNITETREIRYIGELVGRPEVRLTRQDGTYTSTLPITLPKQAKVGKFTVTVTVAAGNVSDSRDATFTVR
jgi:uncharacterized protein YcfJ